MTEHRVVPLRPTEEMMAAGYHVVNNELFMGLAACVPYVREIFEAMVVAAPATADGEALLASLTTFPEDEVLERYRKKLRELADDMVADAEFQVKDNLAPNLAAWVEDLATRAVDALLRGNAEQMRRYLHCDGYTGRGTDDKTSVLFRKRGPHEWHPMIGGKLYEGAFIELRRGIVEAHRDLITEQRILDLEDQVKSLVAQVNRKDQRIEALNRELGEYRR